MEKKTKEQIFPLVSICCTTYNHAPFIRQCLDGFVMQKTSFSFEVLIHDDASTDGTQDIIQEYAIRYPDIIKPIYQTENQYSKGVKICLTYIYPRVKGKYIAICEGDDYWTDPNKLQKQVDFLENHPDYVMCSHRHNDYIQEKGEMLYDTTENETDYDLKSLIRGEWHFHPLTVMYRYNALDLSNFKKYPTTMDVILFFELLKKGGKGHCFSNVMAVYRHHAQGVWSEATLDRKRELEFKARIGLYEVEHSDNAALFLLYQFAKPISRKWMFQNKKMFSKVMTILLKHFGLFNVLRVLYIKIILDKLIPVSDSFENKMLNKNLDIHKCLHC